MGVDIEINPLGWFKLIYKPTPKYQIVLRNDYVKPNYKDKELIDNFWRDNPQYKRDEPHHHILVYEPPTNWYFNVDWYEWFYSIDGIEIKRLFERQSHPFDYDFVRANNYHLGAWIIDKKVGSFPEKIWLILHFQDDYRHRKWCYCKDFTFKNNDWIYRTNQKRKILDRFEFRRKCLNENCPFKNVWHKGDLP